MGFYSLWPYFGGTAVIVLLACTPLLKWADTPPTTIPARVYAIDGLRGFLALGVVFHHAAIYHQYLQTGKWDLPPSRFYANLGEVGVAMFFMITGYLFWAQMLKARGRPNLTRLYVGRVFRIVPLYLLLVVVMLLMVGILTQWRLAEPPRALVQHVGRWLTGGILTGCDVNGYPDTGRITAYVTMTLHYEWLFYASLFVTSFFARSRLLSTLLPPAALLVTATLLQFHQDNFPLAVVPMFCIGMTAASAKSVARPFKIPQWGVSAGIVGCLALVLSSFHEIYSTLPILVLGVAFTLMMFNGTLFGLLLTRPARRLGAISYGIYLLQGPIFFLMFASAPVRSFAIGSAWAHWSVVISAALALTMLATATHALIERPGILAGKWLLQKDRVIWPPSSLQTPEQLRANDVLAPRGSATHEVRAAAPPARIRRRARQR